jgi:hypothetical protein
VAATQDALAAFGNLNYANSKQLITKVTASRRPLSDQYGLPRQALQS